VGNSAKRDKREIVDTEKRRQAVELRLAGATYDQIAEKIGFYDRSSARRSVQCAIEQYRERQDMATEDLVSSILENYGERRARCSALRLSYYAKAVRGDMKAAALLLNIDKEDRENDRDVRRILGLDAATKIEASGADGGPLMVQQVDPTDAILGKLAGIAADLAARSGDPSAKP
jgi:transposase-like protein